MSVERRGGKTGHAQAGAGGRPASDQNRSPPYHCVDTVHLCRPVDSWAPDGVEDSHRVKAAAVNAPPLRMGEVGTGRRGWAMVDSVNPKRGRLPRRAALSPAPYIVIEVRPATWVRWGQRCRHDTPRVNLK